MYKFKIISEHCPKRLIQTEQPFSFFLSGLIDADGHINKLGYFVISFHLNHISVAYDIKTRIGVGTISRVRFKNAVTFICSHSIGKQRLANLIRNKLINPDRIDQYNSHLVPKVTKLITKPAKLSLDNHWLAGFIQGDGSFQIKLVYTKRRKPEVRLVIQIDLKHLDILKQIKNLLGGFIGYRATQNTYYYSTTNFQAAGKAIDYLDNYQVTGPLFTIYSMWRKCYVIIQNKQHFPEQGIKRIAYIKARISQLLQIRLIHSPFYMETYSDFTPLIQNQRCFSTKFTIYINFARVRNCEPCNQYLFTQASFWLNWDDLRYGIDWLTRVYSLRASHVYSRLRHRYTSVPNLFKIKSNPLCYKGSTKSKSLIEL